MHGTKHENPTPPDAVFDRALAAADADIAWADADDVAVQRHNAADRPVVRLRVGARVEE